MPRPPYPARQRSGDQSNILPFARDVANSNSTLNAILGGRYFQWMNSSSDSASASTAPKRTDAHVPQTVERLPLSADLQSNSPSPYLANMAAAPSDSSEQPVASWPSPAPSEEVSVVLQSPLQPAQTSPVQETAVGQNVNQVANALVPVSDRPQPSRQAAAVIDLTAPDPFVGYESTSFTEQPPQSNPDPSSATPLQLSVSPSQQRPSLKVQPQEASDLTKLHKAAASWSTSLVPAEFLKPALAQLDRFISQKGGVGALLDIDSSRINLIRSASSIGDGFFLAIHQIYALYTLKSALLQIDPIMAAIPEASFKALSSLIRDNELLPLGTLKMFASFPLEIELRPPGRLPFYVTDIIPTAAKFLKSLGQTYPAVHQYCRARNIPPMVQELAEVMNLPSSTLQTIIFTAICRNMGVQDSSNHIQSVFVQSQTSYQNLYRRVGGAQSPDLTEATNMRITLERLFTRHAPNRNEGGSPLHIIQTPRPSPHQQGSRPQQRVTVPNHNVQPSPSTSSFSHTTSSNQGIASALGTSIPAFNAPTTTHLMNSARQRQGEPSSTQVNRPAFAQLQEPSRRGPGQPPLSLNHSPMPPVTAPIGNLPSVSRTTCMPIAQAAVQLNHRRRSSAQEAQQIAQQQLVQQQIQNQQLQRIAQQHQQLLQQQLQRQSNQQLRQQPPSPFHPRAFPSLYTNTTHGSAHAPVGIGAPQSPSSFFVQSNSPTSFNPSPTINSSHLLPSQPVVRTNPLVPTAQRPSPPPGPVNTDEVALHQIHLNSPILVAKGGLDQQTSPSLVRFIESFAALPTELPNNLGSTLINFEALGPLPDKPIQYNNQTVPFILLAEGSKFYRVRCVKQPPGQCLAHLPSWTTAEHVWPAHICFRINGKHTDIRRRAHHGKDLPLNLTSEIQLGSNTINCTIFGKPENDNEGHLYVVAVEVVETASCSSIISSIISGERITTQNDFERPLVRQTPLNPSMPADSPVTTPESDDLTVLSSHHVISVSDPFSSSLMTNPIRSLNCKHRDCFDLTTFISSRRSITIQEPSNARGPQKIDDWKCPICSGDARPPTLRIDGWLQDIVTKLRAKGHTSVKSVVVKNDGSWEPKQDNDEGESFSREDSATGPEPSDLSRKRGLGTRSDSIERKPNLASTAGSPTTAKGSGFPPRKKSRVVIDLLD
ncbi:MAG: hypothetical protein M1814_006922 [Vezdaea aestivalis]|nr:MAG: hypothetical protein M1814_006922 [Vezdaea aestivalis]